MLRFSSRIASALRSAGHDACPMRKAQLCNVGAEAAARIVSQRKKRISIMESARVICFGLEVGKSAGLQGFGWPSLRYQSLVPGTLGFRLRQGRSAN